MASEAGARACARLGALRLGDEAILHVPEFDLAGRRMRVTRQAVHRVRRTGAVCRIRRHAHLGEREMEQIVRKADAWRDTETERGFSMALDRLGDPADGDCLLVEALGEDGRLLALLSFVPWGRDGVSLDLMRRDRAAPNGVMEFMVAELCAAAPELGVRRVSLNFAVFRSAFEEGARIGAGPVLRLWRRLLLFLSRWWQLEALYRSNAKYLPEWYPRPALHLLRRHRLPRPHRPRLRHRRRLRLRPLAAQTLEKGAPGQRTAARHHGGPAVRAGVRPRRRGRGRARRTRPRVRRTRSVSGTAPSTGCGRR
ncbi:phosphatidylglycerol lysyltransferase domain-containing protein [Streptomyces olivaceoviridis]|uniref:Phosphatidylglycerol lysyltransferase domain-containing protein n=1 Tax=Streptomyces olivaceoviridis TaxID=1921 RepID=A0ABW7VJM5_STROI